MKNLPKLRKKVHFSHFGVYKSSLYACHALTKIKIIIANEKAIMVTVSVPCDGSKRNDGHKA
jgi:hypothetical protein